MEIKLNLEEKNKILFLLSYPDLIKDYMEDEKAFTSESSVDYMSKAEELHNIFLQNDWIIDSSDKGELQLFSVLTCIINLEVGLTKHINNKVDYISLEEPEVISLHKYSEFTRLRNKMINELS